MQETEEIMHFFLPNGFDEDNGEAGALAAKAAAASGKAAAKGDTY
jgi:hypothetical protein